MKHIKSFKIFEEAPFDDNHPLISDDSRVAFTEKDIELLKDLGADKVGKWEAVFDERGQRQIGKTPYTIKCTKKLVLSKKFMYDPELLYLAVFVNTNNYREIASLQDVNLINLFKKIRDKKSEISNNTND
jgi:hypothetical protein